MDIQRAISDGNNLLILTGFHALSRGGPDLLEFVGRGGHLIIFPDDIDSLSSNLDIFHSSYINGSINELPEGNYQIVALAESYLKRNVYENENKINERK